MKNTQLEARPSSVSATARQGGEAPPSREERWSWVERTVWTERMLQALNEGVKGGVWFSLMDKVYAPRNLRAAFARVKANRGGTGVDRVTVKVFEKNLDKNLERLYEELRTGTYRPQAIRRVYIPKLGSSEKRPLGIPTVRDRVVQTALRNVIEPIYERDFAEHSYGFRPQRGCKDALRRVSALLASGHRWVVDADLKGYFDTIPHDRLMALVRQKVADGKVLALIESYLEQEVMEQTSSWTPEKGTPQGAVISPLLANLYLDPLDHAMAGRGFEMVRYADDFVILCRDEATAVEALRQVKEWTEEVGLLLHPTKTHLVDMADSEGFDFLGYHFQVSGKHPNKMRKWPRKKSVDKLKAKVRELTPRTCGYSMEYVVWQLNRTLKGFFEYFKHSVPWTFDRLDGWVRMRLRSILRKRSKRKGRGRGADNQRWPNKYFHELGLFSMAGALARILQSSPR